jgi:small subunit ribosomal protein S10
MSAQRIRRSRQTYDHRTLDYLMSEIIMAAKRMGARVRGSLALPNQIERFSVLHSRQKNEKSREQFELPTHKRLVAILN